MEPQRNLRVAIISPNKAAFSESFILAHRNLLPFQIFYYHGGAIPTHLEDVDLRKHTLATRFSRMLGKFGKRGNETFAAGRFRESLASNKIDVVLAEYGPTGVAVQTACQALGIPLVVHFHGYDASVYDVLEKFAKGYKDLFQYASSVISVSMKMSSTLISLGCPETKIIYNPCGPADEFFSIDNNSRDTRTLLFVGRFVDKKAPYYTILAFRKVLEIHPDMKLVMGGDGPLLNSCINLARAFNLTDKITFTGVMNRVDFTGHLSSVVAYVQHSIVASNGDSEGTPVTVLEACAAGVPVISTRHAGIADVLVDGETGILVEEHDVDGMAAAIVSLLADHERRRKISTAARASVKEKYSMQHHIKKLADAIASAGKTTT